MKYFILVVGILGISLVTFVNFFPDEANEIIDNVFNKKEYVLAKENEYFFKDNFDYFDDYTDDVNNKEQLINYIYYVINTGSEYADGACSKEYTDCVKDLQDIANNDILLSVMNNFVHPYNSFKTLNFTYTDKGDFSIIIEHAYTNEEITEINYIVDYQLDKLINDNMSTRDKIKAVHDYIIDNTDYDTLKTKDISDDTYKSNTAYGVLKQGKGICSGYADAMSIFLSKMGIVNYKISNDSHIWNLVLINDVWVHLDATWDDPINEYNINRDTYFLISDDELTNLNDSTHQYNKQIYTEAY